MTVHTCVSCVIGPISTSTLGGITGGARGEASGPWPPCRAEFDGPWPPLSNRIIIRGLKRGDYKQHVPCRKILAPPLGGIPQSRVFNIREFSPASTDVRTWDEISVKKVQCTAQSKSRNRHTQDCAHKELSWRQGQKIDA